MAIIEDPRPPAPVLPSSLTAGRLGFRWTTPVSASKALRDALSRSIEKDGGQVVCSAPVTGAITHPGGSLFGHPGRDAVRLLHESGLEPFAVMAASLGLPRPSAASDALDPLRE